MQKTGNRLKNRIWKRMDERGASLVAVIVLIGLVAILAVTCMYMSYANYVMKMSEINAKNNFYSAETVLDQIHTGLQSNVSKALEKAYERAAQTMTTDTAENVELAFRAEYMESLINQLSMESDKSKYELGEFVSLTETTGFYSYLDNQLLKMVKNEKAGGTDQSLGTLKIYADGGSNHLMTAKNGLVIKNFVIEFMDVEGYYSKIKTDICLTFPDISMGSQSNFPAIDTYSVIADNGFEMKNGNTGNNKIIGSIYAGNRDEVLLKKDPAKVDEKASQSDLYGFSVLEDTNLTVSGIGNSTADIIISGGLHVNTETIRGSGHKTNLSLEKVNLWTDSIDINSSQFRVGDENSSTYVQDDMTIYGKGNQILVEGSYIGYGDGTNYLTNESEEVSQSADHSSAIVVNCKQSLLDFSAVKNMLLAGSAYINPASNDRLTYYSAEGQQDNQNSHEIQIGNSLALKTDQLAYLIPRSCIGVYDGTPMINKNPMDEKEYQEWMNYTATYPDLDPALYQKVDFSKTKEAMGIDLRDYSGYGFQVVMETKPSGNLFYVYATFDATSSAKYFEDYATVASDRLKKYVYHYQNTITLPGLDEKVNSIGNVLSCALGTSPEDSTLSMYSYKISSLEDISRINADSSTYTRRYQSMKALMTSNTEVSDPSKLNQTLYQNTINESAFGSSMMTYVGENGMKAIVVNNKGGKAQLISGDSDIALVLATGDVTIDQNMRGLVISGGHVKLTAGHSMEADSMRIQDALAAPTATGIVASTYFVDGNSYRANGETVSETISYTNTKDLISYENWSKE